MLFLLRTAKVCLWEKYCSFRGRANRKEFWGFVLLWFLLFVATAVLFEVLTDGGLETWLALYGLQCLMFLPMIGVAVRRFHDMGHSGWWLWLNLIPFVGGVVFWVWLCFPGTVGPNRYDTDTKIHWKTAGVVCVTTFFTLVGLFAGFLVTQISWRPVEVTEECFFLTQPRTAKGDVDYFMALWEQNAEAFRHPEQNGFLELGELPEIPDDAEEQKAWAREHDAFLDQLKRAAKERYFMPEITRPEGSILEISLEGWETCRTLGRMLSERAEAAVESGDVDRAVDDALTLLRMGRHLGKGPVCVCSLVGIALEGMGNHVTRKILDSGKATDAQLARLEREWETLPVRQTFLQALHGEKLLCYGALSELFSRPNCWGRIAETEPEHAESTEKVARMVLRFVDEKVARRRFGEFWKPLEAVSAEPNPARRADLLAAFDTHTKQEMARTERAFCWIFVSLQARSEMVGAYAAGFLLPAATQLHTAFQMADAQTRLTRLALSVERFRLQTGSYPDTLDALETPDPFDAFTGQNTLTYRHNPQTQAAWEAKYPPADDPFLLPPWRPYLLYSFGPNRTDDGGIPSPRFGSGEGDFF
ncbi:MAG: DUF805 domain-containing protein [Planctomycetia bacterium]|nr:DUF805 domain-containing protein [Planctomycetia bacterium]